jgi:hypothetical protein
MSRGLGQLERFILDEVNRTSEGERVPAHGQAVMLAQCFYQPEDWHSNGALVDYKQTGQMRTFEPSTAQRKAMVRALHSFVRKFPQYALMGGKGRKTLLLYEPGDPVSVAWATSMLSASFVSMREARSRAAAAAAS